MEASEKTPTEEELFSALELLRKLTPEHELLPLAPVGPAAVYTTPVTLWIVRSRVHAAFRRRRF